MKKLEQLRELLCKLPNDWEYNMFWDFEGRKNAFSWELQIRHLLLYFHEKSVTSWYPHIFVWRWWDFANNNLLIESKRFIKRTQKIYLDDVLKEEKTAKIPECRYIKLDLKKNLIDFSENEIHEIIDFVESLVPKA